jgi:hypothetical protein
MTRLNSYSPGRDLPDSSKIIAMAFIVAALLANGVLISKLSDQSTALTFCKAETPNRYIVFDQPIQYFIPQTMDGEYSLAVSNLKNF